MGVTGDRARFHSRAITFASVKEQVSGDKARVTGWGLGVEGLRRLLRQVVYVCMLCFWLCWGLCRCRRFSPSCHVWAPLVVVMGSWRTGVSSHGTRAQQLRLEGSGMRAQELWPAGFAAQRGLWDLPGCGIKPASPCVSEGDSSPLRPRGSLADGLESALQGHKLNSFNIRDKCTML